MKRSVLTPVPGYYSWKHMRQRCYNPKRPFYKWYGARGIDICQRWRNSFWSFIEDVGEKPPGLSIERIDNNGGYWCGHCDECLAKGRPANCKWATPKEQCRNQRSNRYITHNGETKIMAELCEIYENNAARVLGRVNHSGWNMDEALSTPPLTPQQKAFHIRQGWRKSPRARFVEYQGRSWMFHELAQKYGLPTETLRSRIKYGWPIERALTEPVRVR